MDGCSTRFAIGMFSSFVCVRVWVWDRVRIPGFSFERARPTGLAARVAGEEGVVLWRWW